MSAVKTHICLSHRHVMDLLQMMGIVWIGTTWLGN